MTTTIQVSDGTKQLLETIKQKDDYASYDEIIRKLLAKHTTIPSSLFGAGKHMKPWTKKDRLRLHEL